MEYKNILVPYDFSEFAEHALSFAHQLAGKIGATVTVLHVIESPDSQSFNTMGMVQSEEETLKETYFTGEYYKAAINKLKEVISSPQYQGVDMVPKVEEGNPFETISQEINEQDPDMVIMGTKGSSGLEEIFIGSNTEKVVRYSKCPVLTVPSPVYMDQLKKVVMTFGGSKEEVKALKAFNTFRNILDAKLYLLWINTVHVIENEETKRKELEKIARENGVENFEVVIRKNITPEMGIMYFAQEKELDLIAMATHSRSGLAHLFSGSLAEDIINLAQRPVWTFSMKYSK